MENKDKIIFGLGLVILLLITILSVELSSYDVMEQENEFLKKRFNDEHHEMLLEQTMKNIYRERWVNCTNEWKKNKNGRL